MIVKQSQATTTRSEEKGREDRDRKERVGKQRD